MLQKSSILTENDKAKIRSILWSCDVLKQELDDNPSTQVDATLYIRDIYFILEKLKEVESLIVEQSQSFRRPSC